MRARPDDPGTGEMTLAFELSTFKRFLRPAEVFADAREWSRYVGVIGDDTDAVESYLQRYDIHQDFDLGDGDTWLALNQIHDVTPTVRHVFVGDASDDWLAATRTGWEFIAVQEAAEKADWALEARPSSETGILTRLRTRLPDSAAWSFGD